MQYRSKPGRLPCDLGSKHRPLLETLESRWVLSASGVLQPVATPIGWGHSPTSGGIVVRNAVSAGGQAAPSASAYTPQEIRANYGLPHPSDTLSSFPGDGAGQTIAIIGEYDYPSAESDLNDFSDYYGLPTFNNGGSSPTFTKVNQDGGTSLPGTDPSGGWAGELSLDIEWAHALAPAANIVLVECDPNLSFSLLSGVDYARSAPGVSVVSMSWSYQYSDGSEYDGRSWDSEFTTPSGHGGVTFLAATGDDGARAEWPAVSPNVVAVGGTSLSTSGTGYGSESGWSGSGGGFSQYETQPSYQSGVVTQGSTMRAAPDVSIDGDPATGVAIYNSWLYGTSTPWNSGLIGGTSLSTPMWAGIVAAADQQRATAHLSTLDGATQTLPILYNVDSSDFHDITSGNNGYAAQTGYDLVTGRGSPNTSNLLYDLAAPGYASGTVTASDGTSTSSVQISWPRTAGAVSYKVFRAPQNSVTRPSDLSVAPQVGTVTQQSGVASYSLNDPGASAGTTYRYFVTAVMKDGTSHDYASSDTGYVASNPGNPTNTVLQAEDATLSGGTSRQSNHSGYTGTGFADYGNNGSAVQFTVNQATAGAATFSFRYANGSSARPLTIIVNGATIGNISGVNTGSWDTWQNFTITANLIAGTNTIKAVAGAAGGGNLDSLTIASNGGGTTPPPTNNTSVYIDAGGPAAGNYAADNSFSGGSSYSTTAAIDTSAVTDAAPQSAYKTERFGNFTYTIGGLTAGSTYTVRLDFAELYWTAAGKRVFSVTGNGAAWLSNFDIYAAAGAKNKAIARSFSAVADSSGKIVVIFKSSVDNAKVSAISVTPGSTTPVTTSTLINAGGGASGDFVADTGYSGGKTTTVSSGIDTSAVANAAPQAVYQTERYGNFTYTIASLVAGQAYNVQLDLAETYWSAAGKRVFNVTGNGAAWLTNYDLYADVGAKNKATSRVFRVNADSNGKIVIAFTSVVDNAKVSGIRVIPVTS